MPPSETGEPQPGGAFGDTQPNRAIEETHPNLARPGQRKAFPKALPILVVLALVLLGLLAGYGSGMSVRYATEKSVINGQLDDQLTRCQQAAEAGQYELARQYCEYVLNKDPNYPGIKAAYANLLLRMQITPTATHTLTPEISPTPDTRSQEEQFKNAQALLVAEDWNGALAALDTLRKLAPEYQAAQVDGMYYTALYQRGFNEIRPSTDCHDTNLNAGINDFTQAEHFGPLDDTANGLRTYSRLYIAGASFWDQDWKTAQDLFSQVMAAYSTLMDSSCTTASERWRQATLKYAEQLANSGDICGASDQYEAAFTVNSPKNETYFPAATEAANQCHGSGETNTQDQSTPTGETPTPSPTETPTGG